MTTFINVLTQKQPAWYVIVKVLILGTICGILSTWITRYIGFPSSILGIILSILFMFIFTYIADYIYYQAVTLNRLEKKVNNIMNIHDTIKKRYKLDPEGEYDIYRITVKAKNDGFIFHFDQLGKSKEELMEFWKSPDLYEVSNNYEFLDCELYQKREKK